MSPHIQCAAQDARLCMTGKSIRGFLRAFRRNGHLVFPVQEVKGDIDRVGVGAIKCQHAPKKWQPRMTVRKVAVFDLFTFSFRVACFSILAAGSLGLCDGQSLSSHHTSPTLLIRCLCVKTRSKSVPRGPRCAAKSRAECEGSPQRLQL